MPAFEWDPFAGRRGWLQRALALLVVLCGVAALARSALADPTSVSQERVTSTAESMWRDGVESVGLNLGLASPIGELGLTYSYVPVMPLLLELGVGLGITGPQCSAMSKLLVGSGTARSQFGLGVSYTPRTLDSPGLSMWWLNADLVAFEWHARPPGRTSVGFAFGASVLLHGRLPDFGGCPESQCGPKTAHPILPQFRVVFGRWR